MPKRSQCWRGLAVCALLGAFATQASAADDLETRLSRLPRPWTNPIHRLTFEEYEATLKYWAAQHPQLLKLEKRGEAHNGMPVYLLKITESKVPDVDKQVAMVSALHGGPERSGSTTILHLVEWLLGDSALAKETRRKQVVLLMPIINPYAFFVTERFGNKEGVDVYDPQLKWWDLKTLKLTAPEKTPEIAAFISVMDEYQPEMLMDLHGTGLQGYKPAELPPGSIMRQGQTMFEVSACSYSNCGVRPWDPRVTDAMVHAGSAAGFGSDRAEADGQRIFWSPDHDSLRDRTWIPPRADRFRTMFYSYMKYHTMISTTEIGWEQSGVARVGGLLAVGNQPWVYEKMSGYPVTRVRARAGRFITSYGENATQHRRSRVELWEAQRKIVDGIYYPEYEGRATYVCAVTPQGIAAVDADLKKFVSNLQKLPNVNAAAIGKYIAAGAEIRLSGEVDKTTQAPAIQNGIGFRLRIPYRAPKLLDVAVNGHSLKESATDGYQAWYADGYTQLQINVPPAKTKNADLFVVTCAYDANERRTYGFEPPAAVMKQLQNKKTD
ncbi:MAG: M14 family zinc carboxypeptidase [Verrucomicrobiota bacterium]